MIERQSRTKDLIGGGILCAVGIFFVAGAIRLHLGTAQHMGPGYFPLVLGIILVVLSAVLLLQAGPAQISERIAPRPLLAVCAGIAAFALGLHWLGLIPAVFLTVVLASLGDRSARPASAALLGLALAVGAWAVFRLGLHLPMPGFAGLLQWTR
ncbi:tripartite tricarboxylate transporter TctB family protein [Propylenella binzhouense]|uniref:Tripartite tricarboxylate transporter TctB family protein n=1 Tax=Propylenella binzhouense TaxID=2555902 RepID=A0A964T328_9HYPH|nr:tripartite tricarboxylate transporter TctB family protein [Propylenella binzhouense]MYZ47591.1 tripartite tricarboxylate transporter TctB family protein [Propylenella binzhouense]